MIWFTSDTHFGHDRVLEFTDRPWDAIEEMNGALIANINACVAEDDELYVLGDFSYKMPIADAYALRLKINCKTIHLVPGNHDKKWGAAENLPVFPAFTVEDQICQVARGKRRYTLSHYLMADWKAASHGSIHLHGHIHSWGSDELTYNEANRLQGLLRYDVGVDANGYRPVSIEEIDAWFDGVESCGRTRWPGWVNQTGDKELARRLAGVKAGL